MNNQKDDTKTAPLPHLCQRRINALTAAFKISEEKVKELYEDFHEAFQKDKLDKETFCRFFDWVADTNNRPRYDRIFTVFDTNHDGFIDFDEYILFILMANGELNKDTKISWIFQMLDTSGDGRVSYNEVVKFFSASMRGSGRTNLSGEQDPKKMTSKIFEKFGIDESQKLTEEQFTEGCNNHPFFLNAFEFI